VQCFVILQGEIESYVWWFSPQWFCWFLLVWFVFSFVSGRFTGEERFNILSFSPLIVFRLLFYLRVFFMSGRLHRRGEIIIYSRSPLYEPILGCYQVINFASGRFAGVGFCQLSFSLLWFYCFADFEHFTVFAYWGPMWDRDNIIGGRLPYYVYI